MANFNDVSWTISDFSDVSEITPFCIWLVLSKKGLPYNLLGWFFLFSGCIKIFTLVTAEVSINNMPEYHLLAFLEIATVTSFYSYLYFYRINLWLIFGLFVFYAGNGLYVQPFFKFNSLAWVANMFLIIIIGLRYYLKIYRMETDFTPLTQRPDFIITTGWLIYASGSFFPYLMVTDIITGKPQNYFNYGWIFQNISNIIKNLLIGYGLWLTKN